MFDSKNIPYQQSSKFFSRYGPYVWKLHSKFLFTTTLLAFNATWNLYNFALPYFVLQVVPVSIWFWWFELRHLQGGTYFKVISKLCNNKCHYDIYLYISRNYYIFFHFGIFCILVPFHFILVSWIDYGQICNKCSIIR